MLAGLEDHELGIRCVKIDVKKGLLGLANKDVDIDVDENANDCGIQPGKSISVDSRELRINALYLGHGSNLCDTLFTHLFY